MEKITVDSWRHVPAGMEVDDGFGRTKRAPEEPGFYTLYELVKEGNTHAGWKWERE